MEKQKTPAELARYAGHLSYLTHKALGVGDYLAHMTVVYLDMHPFCFYCGCGLTYRTATIEHLMTKSEHPTEPRKPKVLACWPCNQLRLSRDLAEFLASERPMVDASRAGFHFYRDVPQNAWEYLGRRIPAQVTRLSKVYGRGFGVLA